MTPASATAPPSVVMPAAAAPVVGLPPGAVVAGAPQAPSLAADGVVHAVGGECPPCAGTGVDGVVMPAGVVVDGCVRDTAELARCAVGIKALAPHPMPPDKRNEGQRDVPVQVQGVWVRPGDRLVADADGIVVMAL